MSRTGYRRQDATCDVSLSDGVQTFYFNIKGIPKLVNEDPQTPSTLIVDKSGRAFGDWDPEHAHIEQRTWLGGRGNEEFSNDDTKYMDARMAWTLSPYRLTHVPRWGFGEGHYYADVKMPGSVRNNILGSTNMHFQPLLDQTMYARSFVASATYSAIRIQIWYRRIGTPSGNLVVALYSDSSGPNALLTSGVMAIATDDHEQNLTHLADVTVNYGMSASATYWVVVYSTANDSVHNHWEVGYGDGSNTDCKKYVSSWASESTVQLYFRVTGAEVSRRWHFFDLEGALYAVDEKDAGTVSTLYINGDRGIATSATSTVLTDTASGCSASWATNIWDGAWVRITKGTGKGQYREISSNTATALTVTPAFDITPDATSEYVIYNTNEWTDITPAAGDQIDGAVKSVTVFNNIALFAQGASVNCLKMKWNSGTPGHLFDDDGTNKADVVHSYQDTSDGVIIWRGENSDCQASKASATAWGADLVYGTDTPVGDTTWMIQNIDDYDGSVIVLKEDGLYAEDGAGFTRIRLGFNTMACSTNAIAECIWNSQLYFNWAGSIQQLYGGSVDDIGPWLGPGLPTNRRGHCSALEPIAPLMFAAMDGKTSNFSSILAFNKFGFCELFRGWEENKRIRSLKWQANPGGLPRLWFDCAGDIMWMEFPGDTLNPLHASGFFFHHEFVIDFSTIDMRAARLSKMFNDVGLTTQNLGSEAQIQLYYQLDDDIDGTSWMNAGTFALSDWQAIDLQEGDKHRIRLRLHGLTQDADAPCVVIAAVLEAFARTPVKYQWVMKVDVQSMTIDSDGTTSANPEDFIFWIREKAGTADTIVMRSRYGETLDNIRVVVEPASIQRSFVDKIADLIGGTLTIVVRET